MRHLAMVALILNLLATPGSSFRTRAELALENLALRQQLACRHRSSSRARLLLADRAFWVGLSQIWSRWADTLLIVKPDTVAGPSRLGVGRGGLAKDRPFHGHRMSIWRTTMVEDHAYGMRGDPASPTSQQKK
jgi:hypothetical protein